MKAILVYIDKSCNNVIVYNTDDNLEELVLKLIRKFYNVYAYKKISDRRIRIFTNDSRIINVSWEHITLWDESLINKL